METMTLMWLFIVIITLIIEASTFNLITIWIALGALCSMIISMYVDNVILQLVVFIVVTVITLIGTRPFVKKFLHIRKERTNLDGIIDKTGIVLEDITNKSPGIVKAEGKTWTAISDEDIKTGEKVKIINLQGVKLKVERISE